MINFDKLQEISNLRYNAAMAINTKYPNVRLSYSSEGRRTEPVLPQEQVQDLHNMYVAAEKLQELERQELNSLRVREMYHDSVTDVLINHPDKIDLLQALIERWLF